MPYRIAGIDVHKKVLAVVIADVEVDGDYRFTRRRWGASPSELRSLADWLVEEEVEEVVMESTAQYWRPVWETRERVWMPQRRAHLKLSSLVSDLLGLSARRMLQAIADGETEPARLAALGDRRLHATDEQLCDALGACAGLHQVYRNLLQMTLTELRLLDEQTAQLDREMAHLLHEHQAAVQRLAEVPGLGVDSAQQIIAEVGASAATFPSAKHLASWVGVCPGEHESAGVSYSHRSPNGNRPMRRLLNQAANAAVKTKGSIFELVYRRLVPRLGHAQAVWAVAHRLCRLIWKILHQGVHYEERGPDVTRTRSRRRIAQMIRDLRRLGYRVEPSPQGNSA